MRACEHLETNRCQPTEDRRPQRDAYRDLHYDKRHKPLKAAYAKEDNRHGDDNQRLQKEDSTSGHCLYASQKPSARAVRRDNSLDCRQDNF